MDLLEYLTDMDQGEPDTAKDTPDAPRGLGVVYQLESTTIDKRVAVHTATLDREHPELPSVRDIQKAADFLERKVFDLCGMVLIDYPDIRHPYLCNDRVGYSMCRDDDPEAQDLLRMDSEETVDTIIGLELNPDGIIRNKESLLSGDDGYVVNIGPQYPVIHGVMRFRMSPEGEVIEKIDADCGYIHRGIEKMCENLIYPRTLALTDRLDYLDAHRNRHALYICIEQAVGIEVSKCARYIRTIMDKLQRIDPHLLFYSCLVMDLDTLAAFFYGFRDRERILGIFGGACGGRLIMNYNAIGGVQTDTAPDFQKKTEEFIPYLRGILHEYYDVFTGNIIVQQRLKGVGVLSREDTIALGATGDTGRTSGRTYDVRKRMPYNMYGKVDFKEVARTGGDPWVRYLIHVDEIMESLNIIEQLIDNISEGNYQEEMKPIIRIPEGDYYVAVEGSHGEFGVFLESHGDKMSYRLHFRSMGLPLVSIVNTTRRNAKIANLTAVGGTLDYVVPDIDR